jgi:hypothetical protein
MKCLAFSFLVSPYSTKRSTEGTQACRRRFGSSSVIPELDAVVPADAQSAHRVVRPKIRATASCRTAAPTPERRLSS